MRGVLLAGWLAITCVAFGDVQAAGSQQPPPGAPVPSASPERALLDRYCVTCHNQKLKTAGLTLDTMDVANVSEHADVWERVVRKLRAGQMPPSGRPRPDGATYDSFVPWLETELDRAAAARPNPGRTEPFHRLNRSEYQNTIRDVLALDIDVSSLLPTDDASYGFDNIAGVLKMSPTLLDRYLSAARKIGRLAVGTPAPFLNVDTFPVPDDLPQDDRLDGLPFGTRGGTVISYNFPLDAEYDIQVQLSRQGSSGAGEDVPKFRESHDLEISVDGVRLQLFTLAGEPPRSEAPRDSEYKRASRRDIDADWHVRLPVKAGPREITVAFIKKTSAADEPLRLPFVRPVHQLQNDYRYEPYLGKVTIVGPFDATGPGDTPSRRRIFTCRPAAPADEEPCARRILSALARRFYRGPVAESDLQVLLSFYRNGRTAGGFDTGIEKALERLLMSPELLFRIERDPAHVAPNTPYRITDVELASRLSFFLWSSGPDDDLLEAAMRGELKNPAVLERQVRRMLADPRSHQLVTNFAGQWLYLRNLPAVTPDPPSFPDFDESLRRGFVRETEMFVESVLREDRSVLDLLTADYTFLNERLARHYGISGVKGNHFRRVALGDDRRRGLLGHGSILTVTAYPHRTSPVLRGKWVLENILGTPPPPPPPNVPALKDTNHDGKTLLMRDRMVQHRASPVCAGCHSMMDPPGLALETFDAVGRARTVDEAFSPIDASGVLPDGTTFEGPTGLRQALEARPDRFVTTLTEKLLTYALGRGLEYYDAPAVRTIRREAARHDYHFSSIILGIVNSMPFQMRRAQS